MLAIACACDMRGSMEVVFNLEFGASHNLMSNRNRHNNVFINGLIHTMMSSSNERCRTTAITVQYDRQEYMIGRIIC